MYTSIPSYQEQYQIGIGLFESNSVEVFTVICFVFMQKKIRDENSFMIYMNDCSIRVVWSYVNSD